jgi:hypothetical protein
VTQALLFQLESKRGNAPAANTAKSEALISIERIVSSKASRALKENAAGLKTRLEHLEAVPSGRVRASRLAELLDTRLRQPPPLRLPPNGTTWQMDQSTAQHINRSELDAWWPEAFIPGNRLELADRLHPPEVIAAWVPNTWTGVADLSSCQSSQLIEQIKQGRPDRIVVANERETNPVLRLAVLQVVYELLAKAPTNYASVRRAVAQNLATPGGLR